MVQNQTVHIVGRSNSREVNGSTAASLELREGPRRKKASARRSRLSVLRSYKHDRILRADRVLVR
jgi:hypothetical protein